MPRYRVTETSYFGDRIVPAGEEVEFDHDPGFNVHPLDDEAAARVEAVKDTIGARPAPQDPGFISRMMRVNLDEGDAKGSGLIPAGPMGANAPNSVVPPRASGPKEPPKPATVDPAALQKAADEARAEAEREAAEDAAAVQAEHDAKERELQSRIAELQKQLADATQPAKDDGKAKPAGK